MNSARFPVIVILILAPLAWAQSSSQAPAAETSAPSPRSSGAPNSAAPAGEANSLSSGTVISAELSKSLDARKNKVNDKVEAKTSMEVLSRGQILVPRNTRIIGHVTQAKAHSKESPGSMVGIVFDRILMKDGREVPLQAAVQAMGRPLQFGPALNGTDSAAGDTPYGLGSIGQQQRGTAPSGYPSQYPADRAGASIPDLAAPHGSTISPLGPTSRGVIGMKGLSLNPSGQASVVSSNSDNVHLDTGTQLILRVQ